ncbi:LytTR family DNA-binding domain-containing protein [Rheinheimera muenzenbergensis]|uniref:LytTR family DNA-binding domain-containing protein n=1 Tax=Rheinheimera muenzenbergensis TaxID=1193628 RepID=A0ABU8C6L6_9GAMM
MKLKVLIADDEQLARQSIALLLQQESAIVQIVQAADGRQAMAMFEQHKPDLVFLDIQMPGLTGIELASHFGNKAVVVFVTAYDQFAITAFELDAIDYLLKPFDDDRFQQSLQRAINRIREHQLSDLTRVSDVIRQLQQDSGSRYKAKLIIKDPGRIRLQDVDQIDFIRGAGNYAEIHLFDKKVLLHRATMSTLEQQLDPHIFTRIHRSVIIRQACISELRLNERGDYTVILKDGQQFSLSRQNKHKLEQLLA